jgi:hypothetical protein
MSYGTMTSASHLAMGHMVPRPAPFTWQCVIRYHDQCLSPGSMSYGTTTVVYGHSSVSICGGSMRWIQRIGPLRMLDRKWHHRKSRDFSPYFSPRTFFPRTFFPILLSLFFFPYYFPVIVSRTFPPIFLPVLFSRIFFPVLFFTVFFLRPFF